MRTSHLVVLFGLTLFGSGCGKEASDSAKIVATRPGVTETTIPADDKIVAGQLVYVPAYSHVLTADAANPLNLATTLFVRNADPTRSIIVTRVEYFDSGGKSLGSRLKSPLKLAPLASVDFFVRESDESGGASPSFLVDWVATEAVAVPVVESIMISTTGSQGISFSCPGRVIQGRQP